MIKIDYGFTPDGHNMARTQTATYAMLPDRTMESGGETEYSFGVTFDQENPQSKDFIRIGEVKDFESFKAKVEELVRHKEQMTALGRKSYRPKTNTPWGEAQEAQAYARGIVSYSTARHGGFHLSAKMNAKIHPLLKDPQGWYEEDCHWAAVAQAFPEFFTDYEKKCAKRTLMDYYPQVYEDIYKVTLEPGESSGKDQEILAEKHKDDYVVISAIYSSHRPGFVECVAIKGGWPDHTRNFDAEEKRFLVPNDEYKVNSFGFVIDPSKHEAYDGPSDFAGWQKRPDSTN